MEYKALSANEFESCRELLNAFYGTKHFLNCCSFANCEETAEEFTELYRNHPNALESCIIALDTRANNVVCGCIRLFIDEIPRSKADDFLHVPEKDECYVGTVCVSERAQGKGVGTRLLEEVGVVVLVVEPSLAKLQADWCARLDVANQRQQCCDGMRPIADDVPDRRDRRHTCSADLRVRFGLPRVL